MGASRLYIQKSACRLGMQKHRGKDRVPGQATQISKQMLGEPADIAVRSSTRSRGHVLYMEYPAHNTWRERLMHHEVVAFQH